MCIKLKIDFSYVYVIYILDYWKMRQMILLIVGQELKRKRDFGGSRT